MAPPDFPGLAELRRQFVEGRQVFVPFENDPPHRRALDDRLEQGPDFLRSGLGMAVDENPVLKMAPTKWS